MSKRKNVNQEDLHPIMAPDVTPSDALQPGPLRRLLLRRGRRADRPLPDRPPIKRRRRRCERDQTERGAPSPARRRMGRRQDADRRRRADDRAPARTGAGAAQLSRDERDHRADSDSVRSDGKRALAPAHSAARAARHRKEPVLAVSGRGARNLDRRDRHGHSR